MKNSNLSSIQGEKINNQPTILPHNPVKMLNHHSKRFYLHFSKRKKIHINYFTSELKNHAKLLKFILFPLRC